MLDPVFADWGLRHFAFFSQNFLLLMVKASDGGVDRTSWKIVGDNKIVIAGPMLVYVVLLWWKLLSKRRHATCL